TLRWAPCYVSRLPFPAAGRTQQLASPPPGSLMARVSERPFATLMLGFWLPVVLYVAIIFMLIAICLGIMVGTCDELFQSTVPGRQSDVFDLMADTAGLTLAQLVLRVISR